MHGGYEEKFGEVFTPIDVDKLTQSGIYLK